MTMQTLNPGDFDAVLFDMNGTFMFGQDRFGADEDYHAAYRSLGGDRLDEPALRRTIEAVVENLYAKYRDPAWWNRFPSVIDVISTLPHSRHLARAEMSLIGDVIALQELGDIDADHITALQRIAASHPIGVVSNIWAPKQVWLERLAERGILDLFATIVFSSDGPHMKPAPALFEKALAEMGIAPGRALFVGDDPQYDVDGATAVGMRTVLVGDAEFAAQRPDWQVPHLPTLAGLF